MPPKNLFHLPDLLFQLWIWDSSNQETIDLVAHPLDFFANTYPSDSNLIGTIPKLRGSFAIGWRLIITSWNVYLAKLVFDALLTLNPLPGNVQPVLNNVKLDEEERNAQLEECHDAKTSMCLGIWGRMQSSTYSMLFRFTHAPFSRHLHAFSVLRR